MKEGIAIEELRESIREVLLARHDFAVLTGDPAARQRHFEPLWNEVASLGWFGLAIPESFGGLGLGLRELGVLYEELGRFLVPLPVLPTLLAAEAVRLAGSAEQQARWLPAFAGGERRASLALAGTIDSVPQADASGAISGCVPHVLFADSVDELVLPVRGADGVLSLAILARAAPDVAVHTRAIVDVTRTVGEVRLSEARVTPDRLLPLPTGLLDHVAVALACDCLGGAAHIFERTVGYLQTRKQFDRPIGSFQALKHRAATWKIQLEAVAALTRHACALLDSADASRSATASCAKFSASDAYVAIAEDSVQLHGGIGFTWDHECHLFLKRSRLNGELFGSSTQHRERVAELAFGYERERM